MESVSFSLMVFAYKVKNKYNSHFTHLVFVLETVVEEKLPKQVVFVQVRHVIVVRLDRRYSED